jgi:hypothetical protein
MSSGRTFNLINENVRQNCIREIQGLDLDKYEVVIERAGKTPKQRRYWHMILQIVAEEYGDSYERLKHMVKAQVLGYDQWKDRKGNLQSRVLSSEELDTKRYSELIDYTIMVADNLGVTLPDPKFYGYNNIDE